jgi:hypothetical protein
MSEQLKALGLASQIFSVAVLCKGDQYTVHTNRGSVSGATLKEIREWLNRRDMVGYLEVSGDLGWLDGIDIPELACLVVDLPSEQVAAIVNSNKMITEVYFTGDVVQCALPPRLPHRVRTIGFEKAVSGTPADWEEFAAAIMPVPYTTAVSAGYKTAVVGGGLAAAAKKHSAARQIEPPDVQDAFITCLSKEVNYFRSRRQAVVV